MKYIIRDGISTKHIPCDTRDSILLSLHTKNIDGIALCVHETRDNKFIISSNCKIEKPCKGNIDDINKLTLREIEQHEIGTKIVHHKIITLQETLELFKNSEKILLITLSENQQKDSNFMEKFLYLIAKYPTVKLYMATPIPFTNDIEILPLETKIGIEISEKTENYWKENADFYLFPPKCMEKNMLEEKLKNKKGIFIDNIETKKGLTKIAKELDPTAVEEIFVVSKNVKNFIDI